ncbi:MAG: hypothetical protein M1339_04275 [Bacteroidetes bacterium]|nr:hypothetical protein [Bacteroidota bacterium]
MGTGQMLLTIGAVILLGTVILTTNKSLVDNSEATDFTNVELEAISKATSVIQAATDTSFDENTNGNAVTTLSELTPPAQLGQETGPNDFNDFDDYNGTPGGTGLLWPPDSEATGVYEVLTRVYYVSGPDLTYSSTATWSKRLDVDVWCTSFPKDTVKMSTVFSYWYFLQ